MAKRYLGRNINMFLIVMIIISIGSLVALSTYYNKRYEVISNDYSSLQESLNGNITELVATKNELVNLRGQFNQTTSDVEKYDSLYSEKVRELDSASSELAITKDRLDDTKSELLSTTNKLREQETKNSEIQTQLTACNQELSDADDDLDQCYDDLSACGC
ncbi:hypothetical protein H6503_00080 [Candidatus Woesearchaeota archaeon]|nr:hypothetical protein [Candidatus Woesearchaeota archaeon]